MNPYTFQYRGLTFGEGTDILVEAEIEGLRSISVASGSRPAPQFNGSIPGSHLVRAVDLVFPLRVFDLDLLAGLNQAFQPHPTSEFPMQIRLEGTEEWLIYARPLERREVVAPTSYSSRAVPYRVALERTNPYWYGTTLKQVLLPIYSISGGGFELPADLPFDLGVPDEEVAVLINSGNTYAYPLIRVQRPSGSIGSLTGFTITNETTGVSFTMDTDLAAGQTLSADMFAYIHSLRGVDPIATDGASRFTDWEHPRVPLALAPGTNILSLTIQGTADDTTGLITFRDTSL